MSFIILRSEQAPWREFHPCDKSDKLDCEFLGQSGAKLNPKTKVPCGSYELLVSNIAHQMKDKLMIENKFSNFLSEISLKFEICSLFSGTEQPEKNLFLREMNEFESYF